MTKSILSDVTLNGTISFFALSARELNGHVGIPPLLRLYRIGHVFEDLLFILTLCSISHLNFPFSLACSINITLSW